MKKAKMIRIGSSSVSRRTFMRFLNELRYGTHKKARGALQERDNSFCCLGVGCKLFIKRTKVAMAYKNGGLRMSGGMPTDQPASPAWLRALSDDVMMRTGQDIAALNDNKSFPNAYGKFEEMDFTHPEIADILQAVYIEGVGV